MKTGQQSPLEGHSPPGNRPELLAPAGDAQCARAAVGGGADAVYFGLATKTSFNARSRARNIRPEELPELLRWLHRAGVRGYVTLNTLVFARELEELEQVVRVVAEAGADAVLVQDLGVARLVRAVCPELPIHASTQMSLTSAEGIGMVESLGIQRVILARELSLDEIRAIRQQTCLTLEVFVHGALCIAYSGQCLASRTLGARSANRGDCAQPCRLAYRLVRDQGLVDLGPRHYLLSPHDLAAYELVPELIRAGVGALKIEGRLKSPEYVAAVTRLYRRAIDAAMAGQSATCPPEEIEAMAAAFSRGFSRGWLEGPRPRALVAGLSSAKRGSLVGEVSRVGAGRVHVALVAPVKRGDGLVFQSDHAGAQQTGGRVYQVFLRGRPVATAGRGTTAELAFGRAALDWSLVLPGQQVWKTSDPAMDKTLRKVCAAVAPESEIPLDLAVEAAVGQRLRIHGRLGGTGISPVLTQAGTGVSPVLPASTGKMPVPPNIASASSHPGATFEVQAPEPLARAVKHPLTETILREQLGRLGGTPYRLRNLEAHIAGGPMVPLSVLGQLRREMVRQLDAAFAPRRSIAAEPQLPRLRAAIPGSTRALRQPPVPAAAGSEGPQLHVLCRTPQQLESVLDCGIRSVIADYRELGEYCHAVRTARARRAQILLATPRIQKPGEVGMLHAIASAQPDGILARNLAAVGFFAGRGLPVVADFSLNAANDLAVQWLRERGALLVTACHDLNRAHLLDLVGAVPPDWLELVVHLHVPMFHTEYCLACAHLSQGQDRTDCGRPCQQHVLHHRDRMSAEHLVVPDAGCRNTVFHALPQSAAELVPRLVAQGIQHFRVELLDEADRGEIERLLAVYRELLAGRLSGRAAWRRLQEQSPGKLTRGTLA